MTQTTQHSPAPSAAEAIHTALAKAMEGGLVTAKDFEKFASANAHAHPSQNVPFAEGFEAAKGNAKA